jgi:oligopeptide transport system ATP-binding protein
LPEALLQADAVGVRFGRVQALLETSLTIAPGEVVGLVGESGSGKTTLCRVLMGLQRPSTGMVRLQGRALAEWPARALRRSVQMLLQDAVASLSPRMTLRRLLAEPIRIHRLPFAPTWATMESLLRQLGLPGDLLDKYPHQISGGQARRVAMARALILDPALLVADEPTAGLDVSVQGEVLNLLLDLHAAQGVAMLIVSHNLNVVRRVTNRMMVMYLGEVIETAPTAALFARPAHPYATALLSTNPALDPARRSTPIVLAGEIPSPADPPAGCRFHTRCPVVQDVCRVQKPAMTAIDEGRTVRCHFPFTAEGLSTRSG